MLYSIITLYNYCDDHTFSLEMSPEVCANSFYNGELENELRRMNKTSYRFRADCDREECMKMVEMHRRDNVYIHKESDCSHECSVTSTIIMLYSNLFAF